MWSGKLNCASAGSSVHSTYLKKKANVLHTGHGSPLREMAASSPPPWLWQSPAQLWDSWMKLAAGLISPSDSQREAQMSLSAGFLFSFFPPAHSCFPPRRCVRAVATGRGRRRGGAPV